jgi:hypothetical protein
MCIKRSGRYLALFALLGSLVAAACSPEATRTRGGGPGADVGNRTLGPSVTLHGPVNPLYGEPAIGQAVGSQK